MTLNASAVGSPHSATAHHSQDSFNKEWNAAVALEATFADEMLKLSGFGKARDSFGGGSGEEYFSSMFIEHHAAALADKRQLGIAEHVFQAMLREG